MIESMEFDLTKKRFDLYLFDFSEGRAKISKNPTGPHNCMTCHSNDPVPLWESYPVWPGVLGSEHQPVNQETSENNEKKILSMFTQQISQNAPSRYSQIPWLNWYLGGLASGTNTLFGKVVSKRLVERLHRVFTEHLTSTNQTQALRSLSFIPFTSHSMDFEPGEFLNFATEFDPKNIKTTMGKLKTIFSERLRASELAKSRRKALLNQLSGEPSRSEITFYPDSIAIQTCLLFVAKETGIELARWSSSFEADEMQFLDGFKGLSNFEDLLHGKTLSDYPPPERFDLLPF